MIETSMISKDNINLIYQDIKHILNDTNYFDLNSFSPLGSTRLMLEGQGKAESKDLDFAIKLKSEYKKEKLKELIDEIENKFKEYNITLREDSRKIIFSNVITLYLNQDENVYQIDLMISDNSNNNFSYLKELRFYSNEIKPTLKGLHRTELIRSMLKAKGLSLGMNCINQFVLKPEYNDNESFLNFISKKSNSSHKDNIKYMWQDLYNFLEGKNIKEYLSDNNILKTRYGFCYPEIEHSFTESVFDKKPYKINNRIPYWKNIISTVYNIPKNFNLNDVENTLIFLKKYHSFYEIQYILYDYIKELKNKTRDNYYNDEIKNLISFYLNQNADSFLEIYDNSRKNNC